MIPISISWSKESRREKRKREKDDASSEVIETQTTKKEKKKKTKVKKSKRLTGKGIVLKQEPYTEEEIYKLKDLYDAGNHAALNTLIQIYQSNNQI